jgi:hypothetical protein
VRFIYTDEAGTSADEPVTVVVGLVVHADTQWMRAAEQIRNVLSRVPEEFRNDFVFHATAIWGSPKYRPSWQFRDRLETLHAMMRIPGALGIPISLGMYRRSVQVPNNVQMLPEHYHHARAFGLCIATADGYIRDNAGANEVATVVAEDVPAMRRRLLAAVDSYRTSPVRLNPSQVVSERTFAGFRVDASRLELTVNRIIDTIHFVAKRDAPILQVADACAFGLRRFLAGQSYGEDFAKSVVGNELVAFQHVRNQASFCALFVEDEEAAASPDVPNSFDQT